MSLTSVLPPPHVKLPLAGDSQYQNIRPLQPEDRDPIRLLLEGTRMFTPEEVGIALELLDAVLLRPDQKDYIVNVALLDGTVKGYYCVGPTPGTDGTFDLYWIAVDPMAQGQGIGTVLDRHAESLVRSLHGRLMIAETSSRPDYEPTRIFYLRRGYTELSRIASYYRPGDDLVVYGRYITQQQGG
jgi:GNAT superfamily N-acetyltransferase